MVIVGMDVHVRNSFVHVLSEDGTTLRRGRCPNTLLDLAGFLGPFEDQAMRVRLENTTNSRAVQRMLCRYAEQAGVVMDAQVLDARKLRIIAESVTKCDRLDAEVIAQLARTDFQLPVCYLPDDQEFALREHLRARHDLVRLRTRLKNRVHGLLHRRGILTPGGMDLFTRSGRQFLQELPLDEGGRILLQQHLELIDRLNQAVTESTEQLRGLSRRPRWVKLVALLQTMPGVGLITALTVLAELGDVDRFRSRSAVANYAGLVPIVRSSNEKEYRGRISKRGSALLRSMLVEAAWMAWSRVPRYHDLFTRLSHRKGRKVAIVAVARRMLEDSWVMLKREEAFRFSPSAAG
jgi:transposase